MVFVKPGEEGWGTFAAFLFTSVGVAGLVIYAILRAILKTRIWVQVGIEIILIGTLVFLGYRKTGNYVFSLPHNFRGYVVLVYGVNKVQGPVTPLYSNKLRFTVPSSGIILTSYLPGSNYNDPAIFLDSTLGETDKLPDPYKRYGIPHSTNPLKCGDRNYKVDVWIIKDQPDWSRKEDSINRLDLKLAEACELIKQ